MTSLTFHAGKFHVWEIGLLEDLLFFNSEGSSQPAEQLLRHGEGAIGGRLPSRADAASNSAASPALRWPPAGPAGLGQSSSWRVFSYVPRKMKPPRLMAAIRGTTPANKLKAKERRFQRMSGEQMPHGWLQGLWKTKPRKILSCCFLKSHLTAHWRNLSGLPYQSTPKPCDFNPSPHSSRAEAKVQEAMGHIVGRRAQTHPHEGLQADGKRPILCHPHPASAEGPPLSLPGALPPQRQPCSPQRLIPSNIQQGPAGREQERLRVQPPQFLGAPS